MNSRSADIYNKLISQNIDTHEGKTIITFMGISTVIHEPNAMGDLLQSWLADWLTENNFDFRVKTNTQEFPDFLLHPTSNKNHLLEVKTFDSDRNPNFDLANFDAYRRSLLTQAYRLDADYLVFGYTLTDGILRIPRIWLKKIWELAGGSARYPLKCQVKQNVIVNIRPVTWYSSTSKYKPFSSCMAFLEAMEATIKDYKPKEAENWLENVRTNYFEHTGQILG